MNVFRHRISFILRGFLLAGALVCAGMTTALAQEAAPSPNPLELDEAHAALRAAISKNVGQGIEIRELKEVARNLGESLAAANAEAAQYREAYNELRLQMEALGVEAIKDGSKGVSEKLMKAVSDFGLIQKEKETLSARLVALSEAVMAFMQSAVSSNAEARVSVEAALREADAALGLGEARPEREVRNAFEGGRIVSVKRDLGVIVIDLGAKSGVTVGMPFEILRKDRPIGVAFVVDVRDHISGATVRQLASDDDNVEVGDEVRIDTRTHF